MSSKKCIFLKSLILMVFYSENVVDEMWIKKSLLTLLRNRHIQAFGRLIVF
jgi:hypothetical protein